jgi:site-specific DNA recombinase
MNKTRNGSAAPSRPEVRCAVYTRKSTEEGLQQEFNTLDAQRESAEAFIRSQAHEGWTCVPDRYDDGGFTGGNLDRPALKRLLADIEADRIDCVVVYKIDRLSRSLLDFARMMDLFERHRVAFVSTTQQFNSATSMGRLVLNMLLSFAQFEREIISERTRDKIAATRRKGKWTGGHPLLGYDVDALCKLVVNEDEAARVRAIFGLYLEREALLSVVQELARRGWTNKRWTTRKGRDRGGRSFTKTTLQQLLTNVVYLGKVRYKSEIHDGEQTAIVDPDTWQKVQAVLRRNGRSGGAYVRNQFGALLKGILRCSPCGCAMTPAHTKRGARRYRYYTCTSAQQRGWRTCPSKSVPAGEIERFVVDQIRCIGRDPALVEETFAQASAQAGAGLAELEAERRGLERDVARWTNELPMLLEEVGRGGGGSATARLADIQERLRTAERRAAEIQVEVLALGCEQVSQGEVEQALAGFDPLWAALSPREQARLIHLLVERVDYDGAAQTVSVTFHPSGIQALADEVAAATRRSAHEQAHDDHRARHLRP